MIFALGVKKRKTTLFIFTSFYFTFAWRIGQNKAVSRYVHRFGNKFLFLYEYFYPFV